MPDVEKAWAFLRNSDPVSSAEEVQAAIRRVATEIEDQLAASYPLVLAVMGGAVVFAGQILPLLRFPLDFDYLHASRYGSATAGGGIRTVLVLDDILDGGETMRAIRERLRSQGARAFHCAVLVEKTLARPKPITPDFVGLRIADRFVFGCGMDAKGYWRNLPEIRAMKEG